MHIIQLFQRYFFLLLTIIFFISSNYLYSQDFPFNKIDPEILPKPIELNNFELVGNVKECKIENFKAIDKFGSVILGNKISPFPHDNNHIIVLNFTNKGFLCKKINYDTSLNIKESSSWNIDTFGKINSQILVNNNEELQLVYKYSDDGRIISCRIYDLKTSSLVENKIWSYHNFTNLLDEILTFDSVGNITLKLSITCFEDGDISVIESVNLPNSEYRFGAFFKYEYNQRGFLIESYTGGLGDTGLGRYIYDDFGNLIKVINEYNGKPASDTYYKYNTKGYLIEDKTKYDDNYAYKSDYSCYTYEYEYDRLGNWIKKITYHNYIPEMITIRSINYYY